MMTWTDGRPLCRDTRHGLPDKQCEVDNREEVEHLMKRLEPESRTLDCEQTKVIGSQSNIGLPQEK